MVGRSISILYKQVSQDKPADIGAGTHGWHAAPRAYVSCNLCQLTSLSKHQHSHGTTPYHIWNHVWPLRGRATASWLYHTVWRDAWLPLCGAGLQLADALVAPVAAALLCTSACALPAAYVNLLLPLLSCNANSPADLRTPSCNTECINNACIQCCCYCN